jgi:capsular polysaccharide transport system ATP-binding protein
MIELHNISKRYKVRHGEHTVFSGLNLRVGKGEKVGILGRNGAGKSTLIRLISGAELPNQGRIKREMSVSWPLAFGGAFQGSLTGIDNIRFICRVYQADAKAVIPQVEEFAELGDFLKEPVKNYSSGMHARLAFGISMAIEFDCFLIDEVVSVGDAKFQHKCHTELYEKRNDRALVIVAHHPDSIRNVCQRASVLHQGFLHNFNDVDSAYHFYQEKCPN